MKILLIDNGTSLLHKLQKLIGSHEITKKWNTIAPTDSTSYDLIVLSGSSDYSISRNYSQFDKEIQLIKSTSTPVIGICFGCELITHAFGGKLKELATRHHGIREIHFDVSGISSSPTVNVYENHAWIITKVPDNFLVLARSTDGPEMIRHTSLPIFGLQFHPENFVHETEGDEIFSALVTSLTSST